MKGYPKVKWIAVAIAVVAMMAVAESLAQQSGLGRGNPLLNRGLKNNRQNSPQDRARTAADQENPNDAKKVAPGGRSIEFNAAPLDMVFKVYGELTGKTILKDPGTPSPQITLQPLAGQELTDEDKIEAMETVLEMNGIHMEPYGEKFIRALPRKDVRKDGIPLFMNPEVELREATRVVSVMIPFKHVAIAEAQKALEGFKSASGVLNVFERTNSIVITDTEANIKRMREIAKMMDVTTPVTENVFVRQIRNASASDIQRVLQQIVEDAKKQQEKNGKQPVNAAQPATVTFHRPTLGGRNQPQNNAPVNNASVVTAMSDADRGMIRGESLIIADERSNKLIIKTESSNMAFFDRVIEQLDIETTPDTVVKVYRLKYADSEDVSDMINDLIGNAPSSKSSTKGNSNQNAKKGPSGANLSTQTASRKSANQRTGEAKAGELSKENTTVLSDKRINGLVVMTNKELIPVIEQIIESMDIKLSQVLIETAIIEVSLGDDLKTGVDWVRYNKNTGENGASSTWSESVNKGYAIGGGGGDNASTLMTMVASNAVGFVANPTGSGINYFLKSDKLNLGAVIQASKTDSRSKYIASPIIMTVDNKEATINATDMTYLLKGFTSSGNSYSTIAVPDYEQKELGIEIKTTPKINPNGTVMLEVETKYTQKSGSQVIKYATGNSNAGDSNSTLQDVTVPTTATREMSADVLLEDMQTVILGGLTDTYTSQEDTGIPLLKDIPWIGKWLFGKVTTEERRKELLIFMTPYVLDDSESAQAEAVRRKKVMSDVRPWDDRGWSASKLADPVSKKEQLRRIKDEAKKIDEDRLTKLAIEQWKVERAGQLKDMTKDERDHWLELHKKDIEEAEQEELEKKMLDKDSQDELRKLAEQIRAKKLKEAEGEIKKADDASKAESERARLDDEKAKSEESQRR